MTNGASNCTGPYVGLSITSVALLMSVCLNILLYSLRRKDRKNRDVGVTLYQDSFHSDRFEEEEQQNQDNPIYGNIFVDGGGSLPVVEYGDYEQMTKKGARQDEKSDPEDVSYASLDLRLVQKRKKKRRYQEKQNQMHKVQTHPPPGAQMRRMEMGADCDVALPSRSSSLIVSRSSIYLNSHQVALETEELQRERERERGREAEWKSNHE
ncbi:hypothetical protein PHYPO_G00079950 [Pangasianodon hypophthalmus]|uniref:Uncharacterized protein n=1 Tax=Pangasianodon hypophthalmus TaxID=310915 RepID=A0A5N5LL83_PANHP|nr:uncharacterized protein LOC113543445 [Pangasianodon hypophthalmus]KAB5543505.1 hypothetical protein PHYPO_G00079950 [Pangasianodon hypophthalmus]